MGITSCDGMSLLTPLQSGNFLLVVLLLALMRGESGCGHKTCRIAETCVFLGYEKFVNTAL